MEKDFNKSVLVDIIDDFSEKRRVFSNEVQFQFELGQALEKKGYRVLFEVLSISENAHGKNKIYTDIVVDLGDKRFVAVELKYKSAIAPGSPWAKGYDIANKLFTYGTYNGIEQCVFPQGAEDTGSYYFIKDIERLENFTSGKTTFNFHEDYQVVQAYAIIIANSKRGSKSAYWAEHEGCKWKDYSLEDGRTIKRGKLKKWKTGKTEFPAVELQHDYVCKWHPYYNSEDTDFPLQFMIMEILRN